MKKYQKEYLLTFICKESIFFIKVDSDEAKAIYNWKFCHWRFET